MTTYKEEYIEKLDKLQNFLDFAIDVTDATAEKKNVPWRYIRAHQLYNRLTVNCLSFIHLLPKNRYFPAEIEFWDFFSVASLARNFIENYYTFFYIGVDEIDENESDLRLLILRYHLNLEKYKLFKELGSKEESLAEFEDKLPLEREKIASNEFFITLDKKNKQAILSGKSSMYLSRNQISEKIKFETKEVKPLYRIFSNHTHSSPLSFFSMSNEIGRGLENEKEVVFIMTAIDFVTKYLLASIIDIIEIFPECEKSLHKVKLEIIRSEFNDIINANDEK